MVFPPFVIESQVSKGTKGTICLSYALYCVYPLIQIMRAYILIRFVDVIELKNTIHCDVDILPCDTVSDTVY